MTLTASLKRCPDNEPSTPRMANSHFSFQIQKPQPEGEASNAKIGEEGIT